MGGKASGALAVVIGLLGLLLITAAIRGTYIPVWHALTKTKGADTNGLGWLTGGGGGGGGHTTSH